MNEILHINTILLCRTKEKTGSEQSAFFRGCTLRVCSSDKAAQETLEINKRCGTSKQAWISVKECSACLTISCGF